MRGTTILISRGGGVRFTPSIVAQPMAPHAVRLLIGVEGEVRVVARGREHRGRVVATRPDREHVAVSEGPAVCFLFDPEHTGAVALLDGTDDDAVVIAGALGDRAVQSVEARRESVCQPNTLRAVLDEVAASLPRTRPRLDRRVARAIDIWLTARGSLLTVDGAAKGVGLSQPHFRDVFTSNIGIPPRRYRTWVLLLRAFRAFDASASKSVTEIAHEAGFADLAHFARACRIFLGVKAIGNHLRDLTSEPRARDGRNNPRLVQASEWAIA